MAQKPFHIKEPEREKLRNPQELINEIIAEYGAKAGIACSFQAENSVIIDMAMKAKGDVTLFSIDTGRLPEETYDAAEQIRKTYGYEIRWFFPDKDAVQEMIKNKGLYSFRQSVDNRKECCHIRKVEPFERAVMELGLDAMIGGRRREHSHGRMLLPQIEVPDVATGFLRVNPIVAWTQQQVWDYVKYYEVPYNKLYERGYVSIGCEPCTRSVLPGDNARAGRWWWEKGGNKECGIHLGGSGI